MTLTPAETHFDFGKNWKDYSEEALADSSLQASTESLKALFQKDSFSEMSFLDVGCGSGVFSIAAKKLGAPKVVGFDISRNSIEAARNNSLRFLESSQEISFIQGSILDPDFVTKLGTFDAVYAWGSLHHTGDLWRAVKATAHTVKPGGELVLAIYRTHWTSPFWLSIKKIYNWAPRIIQRLMVACFYVLILIAKTICTGKNPYRMGRGMSFYHDVVDWIGGYPYQYATKDEVVSYLREQGFKLTHFIVADLPTGNHQYLFKKSE